MSLRLTLKNYAEVPITRHLILELLKNYKSPNDKISEMLKKGELISIRRGLYIPGPKMDLPLPEPFLIANHLRGPSYVSLESALSYWNLIPERVFEISSATTKSSKKFRNNVGRFSYFHIPLPYYSFGVNAVKISEKQRVLMASPEKAICDKIVLTAKINLRSKKQIIEFLIEDLRLDYEMLEGLDITKIESWLDDAPKKRSLNMLVQTLHKL